MMPPAASGLPAPIRQVALVVRDLDAACRSWVDRFGIGPWTAFTLEPPRLRGCTIRGHQVDFGLRHALAWSGEVQFELVEPRPGPGIFTEHLAARGEGLQHLGAYVDGGLDAHATAVEEVTRQGFTPLQSAYGFGADGDGAFAYFDPGDGTPIIELISAPKRRIEPDFVYPAPERTGTVGTTR